MFKLQLVTAPKLSFLYAYILASYGNAWLATYYGWPVAFGYQDYFSPYQVLTFSWLPATQIALLVVGQFLAESLRINPPRKKFRSFRWYSPHIIFIIIMGYVFYIVYVGFFVHREVNYSGEIHRVLEGKGSQFFLIAITFLALTNYQRGRFSILSISLPVTAAALYALIDGSRSAILPSALITIYALNQRQWKLMWAVLLSTIPILMLTSIGRTLSREVVWSLEALEVVTLPELNLSYFLGFSYLHVFYGLENYAGKFNWADFFYSITPLPSKLIPFSPTTQLWRIDVYRPLGAQTATLLLSVVSFAGLNIVVGFLAAKVKTIKSFPIRALAIILITLGFAASFQYHLRTVQWFFWLAAVLVLLNRGARLPNLAKGQ